MRISELIIRLIDWFYRKPVAAIQELTVAFVLDQPAP